MKQFIIIVIAMIGFINSKAQYTPKPTDTAKHNTAQPIAKSFITTPTYNNLGWGIICKKEWQLEKAIKIPVKIRLGSVDYCNMLEGKKY